MQALLIAHRPDEAAVLAVLLQQAGCVVSTINSLEQANEKWPERPFDLILITLKDEPEAAVKRLRQIRAHTVVPLVLIAPRDDEDFLIHLLELGADLVVTRPYRVAFLVAQLRALLRRCAGLPYFSLPVMEQGDLSLDPASRTVTILQGEPRYLTQLEFRLLYTLMTHAGQIIPAENLVELVWGYSGEGNRELVRGLVQRLRSKVEPDPRQPRYIQTAAGIGYSLLPAGDPPGA